MTTVNDYKSTMIQNFPSRRGKLSYVIQVKRHRMITYIEITMRISELMWCNQQKESRNDGAQLPQHDFAFELRALWCYGI